MSEPVTPALPDAAVAGLASNPLADALLPVALAIITLGMGLSLGRDDFVRIAREPRAVLAGLVGQVLVLPALAVLIAFVLHRAYGLAPALAMGLLLLACCPGGATSNLVTHLARADTALSVTLTAVASFLSVLTTPLLFLLGTRLVLGDSAVVRISFADTALLVLVVVALPIVAGMAIRRRFPFLAAVADAPLRAASVLFLALVIALVVYENRVGFFALARQSVPSALLLNALALGSGLLLARAMRLRERQARAVSIEVGFQNGTLGITLAITQLHSPEAALVPGFYSLVMFLTGGALAMAWSRAGDAGVGEPGEAPAGG